MDPGNNNIFAAEGHRGAYNRFQKQPRQSSGNMQSIWAFYLFSFGRNPGAACRGVLDGFYPFTGQETFTFTPAAGLSGNFEIKLFFKMIRHALIDNREIGTTNASKFTLTF